MNGIGKMLELGGPRAAARIKEIESMAFLALEFSQMDNGFLYDKTTHLMTIGYAVAEQRCDSSYYDLVGLRSLSVHLW